jgi:hypothetical protein
MLIYTQPAALQKPFPHPSILHNGKNFERMRKRINDEKKVCMAAGIYFDNRKMYEKGKRFYLHGHDNGTIENYIDGETGQIQESGRDQAHS